MAKSSSTPIAKAARLLDLVPFISTHQGIAIKELAAEFDVSVSELLDDLNTLWMCGLPGYTPLELIDLSFDSGFVSIRNAEVLQKVRVLTKEELVVIAIGLDLLRESISVEREDLLLSITNLANRIKTLTGEVSHVAPTVNSAHRAVILRAMKERKDLEITYHSLIRDEVAKRRITPLELGEDSGLETLYAYCHKAKAFRLFRLDNFKDARISEQTSQEAKQQATTEEFFTAKFRISRRLRTTLERFRLETSSLAAQKELTLQVQSFSQEWLIRNFLSTLGSTEILEPQNLSTAVREKAQTCLDLYNSKAFATQR